MLNCKKTIKIRNDDVRTFIKLSSKYGSTENSIFKKAFLSEDDRQILNLQVKGNPVRNFKCDYIYNEYENTILMFCKLKPYLIELLNKDKNLSFFVFGQEKLGKTNFFFGKNKKFTNDSLFKYTLDVAIGIIKDYDLIVFDVIMMSNEKFMIDYRNITYDPQYEMIEYFNQIFNEVSQEGHLIITVKFLKQSVLLSERTTNSNKNNQVEIIRSITFVDIEGFNKSFTDVLMNNKVILEKEDPKNYSLFNMKNLYEAISNNDIEKFCEINSLLSSAIIDVFRIQNSNLMLFGFIDPNELAIMESLITLEILMKFKMINLSYFFDTLQEVNIENSLFNKYSKQEFYILENIFSEIVHSIQNNISLEVFFNNVLSFSQEEKFYSLKVYLEKNKFNFEKNILVSNVLDTVFNFLNDRSKWKELHSAHEALVKKNSEMRKNIVSEPSRKNTIVYLNSQNENVSVSVEQNVLNTNEEKKIEYSKSTIKESDELKLILKQLSKIVFNTDNENNNSIFEKRSIEQDNIFKNYPSQPDKTLNKNKEESLQNKSLQEKNKEILIKSTKRNEIEEETKTLNFPINTKNLTNIGHSVESNCGQYIIKEYMKNLKKSILNVLFKMENEESCIGCQNDNDYKLDSIDFNINVSKFKLFKSASHFNKITYSKMLKDSPRDCAFENQFKSTNIKTFISKNQEENIKNKTIDNHNLIRKMTKFDDKLSIILDNSKNNSFFSNNKNNISLNRNSHSDIKNNVVINQSFKSLNCKNNIVINEKISRIEEKMSKIKKNGSFDTILLNILTDKNNTIDKAKSGSNQSNILNYNLNLQSINPSISNKSVKNSQQLLNFSSTNNHQKNKNLDIDSRIDFTSGFNKIKDSNLVLKNPKNINSVLTNNNPITNENKKATDNNSIKEKKISLISEKFSKLDNKNMNLDSRVNSENDISKLKESNFLKNNSFLSYNI